MADPFRLYFLPGDKPRQLHNDAHQHHRPRLRGFAGQGHDAGKNPLPALAGDRFVDVGNIGVGIPRYVIYPAASQSGDSRDEQQ